jgi:hypothetical protein
MIIACPECSGPFELRDGDIAELVQLDCPSCSFRMILDFAAANDPRLVEVGMKMASGYRSATDYRDATSGRPPLHAVDEAAEPLAAANEVARADEAARADQAAREYELARDDQATRADEALRTEHAARADEAARQGAQAAREHAAREAARVADEAARVVAARAADAESARVARVAADADWDDDEETRVAISSRPDPAAAAPTRTPSVAASPRPARTGETVVGPMPSRASERADAAGRPSEETTEPVRHRDEVVARGGEATGERRVKPPLEPAAEAPRPRVTDDRPSRRGAEPVAFADPDADLDLEPRKGGVLGALLLVLLLVLAVGITIASVVRRDTPDPRPLLEDLYRQYLQR